MPFIKVTQDGANVAWVTEEWERHGALFLMRGCFGNVLLLCRAREHATNVSDARAATLVKCIPSALDKPLKVEVVNG